MLKKRILVIGQVPPPYGGQNIMTKLLLDLKFSNFKLLFLPTNYSKNFKQVGKFKIIKIINVLY